MKKLPKKLSKGCPQGSVVGPDLWNVCFDKVLRKLVEAGVVVIAYADDLILIVHGNSRRSWNALLRCL